MRTAKIWALIAAVLVAVGVLLPMLDTPVRIAVVGAGVLLLFVATSRTLSPRTGDGDPRSPQDKGLPPESWGGGAS